MIVHEFKLFNDTNKQPHDALYLRDEKKKINFSIF